MNINAIIQILTKYAPSLLLGVRTTMIIALIGTGCGFILGLVVGGIKAIRLDLTSSKASRIFKKIIDFIITVYTGAYMAEIIRSGIQAVDIGQTEAARSLGMSNAQTMFSVVLPQAIKNAFPAIGNELIVNIKDSSVLMIISITELMFQSKSIAGSTFQFTTVYFIEAMMYLILTSVCALILNLIEKKLNNDTTVSLPMSSTEPRSISYIEVKEQKGANSDYVSR